MPQRIQPAPSQAPGRRGPGPRAPQGRRPGESPSLGPTAPRPISLTRPANQPVTNGQTSRERTTQLDPGPAPARGGRGPGRRGLGGGTRESPPPAPRTPPGHNSASVSELPRRGRQRARAYARAAAREQGSGADGAGSTSAVAGVLVPPTRLPSHHHSHDGQHNSYHHRHAGREDIVR